MAIQKKPRKLLYVIASSSLLFYALSGLSSLLNYAVYPVISRLVTTEQYGEIQFLLSAFNQLSVGFVVLNILAVIIAVTTTKIVEQRSKIRSLNVIAGTIAALLALIGTLLLFTLSPQLQLTSPLAIILIGVALILNVPFTILLGQLQGNDRFVQSGIVGFIATISKFILSIAFVMAGFGVTGAILGVVLGMGIAILVGYLYAGKSHATKSALAQHLVNLSSLKYVAIVGLLSVGFLTLMSTIDSILSRIILSPEEAGMYAAVATLAKIILAGTAPLLWLTLPPAISEKYPIVTKYLSLTALFCILLTSLFSIDPSALISLSMAIDAASFASLLPLASISMSVYAIAFILSAISLCTGHLKALVTTYSLALTLTIALCVTGMLMPSYVTMTTVIISQAVIGLVITAPLAVALQRKLASKK